VYFWEWRVLDVGWGWVGGGIAARRRGRCNVICEIVNGRRKSINCNVTKCYYSAREF
jgi:hypothetical protein